MASAEQLKLVIDVVNKNALKSLGDLKKATKGVGDELTDARSDAKRLAAEMERRADGMVADLQASERAAEALANALGPEMAAKIGGAKLDSFVGDLKRAGLSFEEVEADAESFAQALKKMDAAADSVKDVDTAMARVGQTADNTRSVFANFAGNAAQELPGVATALGPVNMAISQFVEYAAEGNIRLSEMLKFAGPMAGIGVAVALVANHMEQVAKAEAFKTARIDAFTKALKEGASAAEAWDAALTDDGNKVEFVNAATGDVEDLTEVLADNNVTWQEFRTRLMEGRDAFEAWARETFPAKDGQEDLNHALQAGWQIIEEYDKSTKRAADNLEVYGGTAVRASSRHQALITKYEMAADAAKDAEQALQDYHDTMRGSVDASFALFDAQNDLTQSLSDLAETTDDPETAVNELDMAQKDAAESAFNLADAQVAQADAAAKAAGKTLTAAEKNDILVGSLQATADQLAPGSPLRVQLELYIAALKRIPPNVTTALSIAGTSSRAGLLGQSGGKRASGGQVQAGVPYTVGEQGTEMFVPNTNGVVVPHGMTQQMMQGGVGGGGFGVVNIFPRTMPTERELIDLINGIRRKQGGVI